MKKIKFGILGLGRVVDFRVAKMFLNELKNSKVTAICDKNNKKLKKFTKKFECKSFKSLKEFMKEDFDFVYIATESGNHFKHILYSFKNNKNVIVEKPPVLKVFELKKLDKIAKKKKLKFFAVFQNRYNKSVQYLKKEINKIKKDIVTVNLNLYWSRPQKYYSDWHGNWNMDGGVLAQQGIHYVDLLNFLFGSPIKCISTISNKSNKLQAEDTHNSIIVYKNKISCMTTLTTSLRPKDITATIEIYTKHKVYRLHGLCCNKIKIKDNKFNKKFKTIESKFSENVPSGYGLSHKIVFQKLINNTLNKKIEGPTVAIETLKTVKLVNMMYKSSELNKWIYFNEKNTKSKLGY